MHGRLQLAKVRAMPQSAGAVQACENSKAGFHKAGLLDLPFIYQQIIEGSVEGVYSDRFLTGGGNVNLFRLLLVNLLPFGKRKLYDFLMYHNNGNEIGFAGIYTGIDQVEPRGSMIIGFFGIASEYRGKKHGILMMRKLIEHLPADARIAAYTTKFASGMQRLLSRSGFRQSAEFAGCKQKVYIFDKRRAH
jgi:hypothetical protein